MNIMELLGRSNGLFESDLLANNDAILERIYGSSILVVGGAGTIGRSVAKVLFSFRPSKLHVVDISENNLVEVVREIRSTDGDNSVDFRTFAIDVGSRQFDQYIESHPSYDYIFNLSALKHVRSERDPYTLSRLVEVNIFNSIKLASLAYQMGARKYFCVSTDKAANPANMMGASKRIMELFLLRESIKQNISFARFANVAFSDGSLLHGFNQRFLKEQPFSAPLDIKRYFVTEKESGELCVLSSVLGENREIFFPKLQQDIHELTFAEIAKRFLVQKGFEPYICEDEEEARRKSSELIPSGRWPCYFFISDTTGEKSLEEFFTSDEKINLDRFAGVGVISADRDIDEKKLDRFLDSVAQWNKARVLELNELVKIFQECVPNFQHENKGKDLDQRM